MTWSRYPLAVFSACSQSHGFDERQVNVPVCEENAIKIGRSVAHWKPGNDNAIFDCKVLSRNHAVLWYEEGCFYLKDTKSSNGTFVNNERLSKSAEESSPRQIFSGDILQFGVEIVENANKVTHGCIIAIVRLFDCNGDEVLAPETSTCMINRETDSQLPVVSAPLVNSYQLFQLQQYIREAVHREKIIEQKLSTLENILFTTEKATESSWQALISEDHLLSRIEMLEGQLSLYSKNLLSDKVKEQMNEMIEDKSKFELMAKESLRRAQEEKNEALQRLSDVEHCLVNTEEESAVLRQRIFDLENELTKAVESNFYLRDSLSQTYIKLSEAKYSAACNNYNLQGLLNSSVGKSVGNGTAEKKKVAVEHIVVSSENGNVDNVHDDGNNTSLGLMQNMSSISNSDFKMKMEIELENLQNELKRVLDENFSLRSRIMQEKEMVISGKKECFEDKKMQFPDYDIQVLILFGLPFFAVFFLAHRLAIKALNFRTKRD